MDPLKQDNPLATPQMPSPVQEVHKSSIGPVAGAIIIILLLVAGGLYFWGAELNKQSNNPPPFIPSNDTSMNSDASMTPEEGVVVTSDASVGLPPQSSSDDISSIEADAAAMDLGALDSANSAELNNI